jgi:hypothetical protein
VTVSATFIPDEVKSNSLKKKRKNSVQIPEIKFPKIMSGKYWGTASSSVHVTGKRPDQDQGHDVMDIETGNFDRSNVQRVSNENWNESKNNGENDIESCLSGKLVIVVADSGAGLSEVNQKRLFKEVYRCIYIYVYTYTYYVCITYLYIHIYIYIYTYIV